jgi:hypothetical protein
MPKYLRSRRLTLLQVAGAGRCFGLAKGAVYLAKKGRKFAVMLKRLLPSSVRGAGFAVRKVELNMFCDIEVLPCGVFHRSHSKGL